MNNKFVLSVATALILSATPALAAEKAAGGVITLVAQLLIQLVLSMAVKVRISLLH